MLTFLTLIVIAVVIYAFLREGALTAFSMLVNVFLAGLVAFNFWEPIAALLDGVLQGTPLHGFEDAVCLVGLFCLTLGLLRLATNSLARTEVELPGALRQGVAAASALVTGYLVAGFLVCVLQTLPWQRSFMGFDAKVEADATSKLRRILPPDRVWLAMMQRASALCFSQSGDPGFDPGASFEPRYARLRRYIDTEP